MLIEITIASEQDKEHVAHLLTCEEHGQDLVDKLIEMMEVASNGELPCKIAVLSMELRPAHSAPGAHPLILISGNKTSGSTYRLVHDGRAIMCLRCGLTSHNSNDVKARYCSACKTYHSDVSSSA